jgi:hypothetical protein
MKNTAYSFHVSHILTHLQQNFLPPEFIGLQVHIYVFVFKNSWVLFLSRKLNKKLQTHQSSDAVCTDPNFLDI